MLSAILYAIQRQAREIKNKTIQLCWEYQGFSSEYKKINSEYPKAKQILNYADIRGYAYDKLKTEYTKHNRGNYTTIINEAVDSWKNNVKDILIGDKSIMSFKKDLPIDLHNINLKVIKENNKYYINLSLISNEYKKELNVNSGQFMVEVKASDNSKKTILNNILSGEYGISASKIIHNKNKWFINLCYKFDTNVKELDENNIMGVDMGIVYPVYMAFNNSFSRYEIEGGEIEHFRKSTEKRKNQLYAQGKYCGAGRIGHGILTRIKPINFATNRVANFRDFVNHKYSKYVVEMAIKHNCGTIQMEDLKGISKENSFLKKWSYHDLQEKIEYKAKEHGIKVVKIDPKYTSQRCSECGCIEKDNRKDQKTFECLSCGWKTNADYNAARNIATKDIDFIIADYIKEDKAI
jgi:IS605 OrfB family transposase